MPSSILSRSGPGVVILALVLALWAGPANAARTGDGDTLQRIRQALNAGDVRALLEDAADRIEVVIFGRGSLYSRSQAMYVMQDFFRRYPPERFVVQEQMSTDGSLVATGRYWTRGEEAPAQVYLHLRLKDRRWELREIRIEASARQR